MSKSIRFFEIFFLIFLCHTLSLIIFEQGIYASVFVCISYIIIGIAFSDKKKTRKDINIRKGALSLLFFLSVNMALSIVLSLFFTPEIKERSFSEMILAVLLFPISEELAFRKALFGACKKFTSLPFATLLSSLIFAFLHADIASAIVAFIAGIILALMYEYTESIILPIVCHIANNLLAGFLVIPDKLYLPVFLLAICAIIFVIKAVHTTNVGEYKNDE